MICIDTETASIAPGVLAPPLTCLSWARPDGSKGLLDHREAIPFVLRVLDSEEHIVGHNIAFDLAVLANESSFQSARLGGQAISLVFEAYEQGRVHDTLLRQQLLDLSAGQLKYRIEADGNPTASRFGLKDLVKRYFQVDLDKSTYRTGYGPLRDKPLSSWPEGARDYAIKDAVYTLRLFLNQCDGATLTNEVEQTRAAWALHLISCRGVITDSDYVVKLKHDLTVASQSFENKLLELGLNREKRTKKRATGAIVRSVHKDLAAIRELVLASLPGVELTESGLVPTDEDTLRRSLNPALLVLADSLAANSTLSKFIPVMEQGTQHAINCTYNCILETGRTSCRSPNLQQLPRAGGVREGFIPRDGFQYCSVDYDTAELRSLSQVCTDLGIKSRMADAFRQGRDPHLELGAQLLGMSYIEAVARKDDPRVQEARQFAKIPNFGLPGGMGAETFVEYAASNGVALTMQKAEKTVLAWKQAWPEMPKYFRAIERKFGGRQRADIVQLRSGRQRGQVRYTAACNTYFQGLTADGAKHALWKVARECYLPSLESPLLGSRPVVFMHDEIIAEVPKRRATEASDRLALVMREAMSEWVPDVPVTAKPALMARWFKSAKEVRNVAGELLPWRPAGV